MRMSTLLNEVKEIEGKLLSERVTSTAFRKKTARVNPMTQKDIERMIKDRKYKGNTSGLMKDIKKKFPDEYESDIVQDMMRKHAETNEAVSPAQQAAIAISKKERGEKPKDEKDEGNTFGKELKAARDKGEKTFVVSGKKYNVEDYDVKEEITEKFSDGMIDKLRKAYEPLRGKKIPPAPLMKIFDKIDSNKNGLIQLYKADIPFVSMMAMSRLMLKHNMKADDINKLGKIRKEEFELDEKKLGYALVVQQKDGSREIVAKGSKNDMKSAAKKHGGLKQGKVFTTLTAKEVGDKVIGIGEEVTLDEEVEDIFIKKGNVDDIARRVAKNARGLGLKAAVKGSVVRIKGAKKKVSDFLRITIGKTSSGDASTVGKVSSQDDSLLNLQFEEINEMAYKPGSFKDTRPQEKTAKSFDKYIKTGGLDQEDFEKARKLYVQTSDVSSRKKLRNFIQDLDTAPMETVMDIIGRNDPDTFEKMYPDAKSGEFLSKISFRHRKIKNEEVELDEMDMKYVLINMQGKVQGYASDKKDALDIARRTKSTMHPIKKKITDKTLEKMNALAKTPKELKDLGIIEIVDPMDLRGRPKKKDPYPKSPYGMKHPLHPLNIQKRKEKEAKKKGKKEEVELDEKYDLYHKDFSSAMQHAYSYAKQKLGITIDPKEIDSKVATGPKKPTEGKTNKYRLKGKGGNLQIQVYNKGGSKPFELNMYKEENDLISQASKHISHMQMAERKVDPADVDDDASEKDVENAAKNIIMQLRKSVSMRGNKDVEFADGKQKVDMKIAQKAISMHMKMKPQDKLTFQNTIAKSYKDLLNAVKGK